MFQPEVYRKISEVLSKLSGEFPDAKDVKAGFDPAYLLEFEEFRGKTLQRLAASQMAADSNKPMNRKK